MNVLLKRMTKLIFIIVALLSAATLALDDEFKTAGRTGDEEFTVIKIAETEEADRIEIGLKSGYIVNIGTHMHAKETALFPDMGVMADSIRVHNLTGKPDLLHIEWVDYPHGEGNYQEIFYIICPKNDPEKILVKGFVYLSARGGAGNRINGSYKVDYNSNKLYVKTTNSRTDVAYEPKPLYHPVHVEKDYTVYRAVVSTTVTRILLIGDTEAVLNRTLLEYEVQDGDTIETICKGLNVEKGWILNPDYS
jgi:hypothetical protein